MPPEEGAGGAVATAEAPDGAAAASAAERPATSQDAPQDWRQTLPEPLRADKSLATFKDVGALAGAFVETKKMQGGMVRVPGPDAKPEELAAFREKLGVPKDVSGYTPPQMEGLDAARWGAYAAQAHTLGLTPGQLEGLARFEAEERAQHVVRARQAYHEAHDTLKSQWGETNYNRRVTLAQRTLTAAADGAGLDFAEDVQPMLEQTGLGDHPILVRLFAALGEQMGEHGLIEGRVEGLATVDDAKAKLEAIKAQGMKHPANNPELPGHREAAAAAAELYKTAYGTRIQQ